MLRNLNCIRNPGSNSGSVLLLFLPFLHLLLFRPANNRIELDGGVLPGLPVLCQHGKEALVGNLDLVGVDSRCLVWLDRYFYPCRGGSGLVTTGGSAGTTDVHGERWMLNIEKTE